MTLGPVALSHAKLAVYRCRQGHEITYLFSCGDDFSQKCAFPKNFVINFGSLNKNSGVYKSLLFLTILEISLVKGSIFGFYFFAEKIKEDEAAHQRNQSIDIREKNGRITCQFRGDGTYTVSWNRNGNLRLRDGIREENTALIINNVSFDDKGIYKCTAVGPKNTATAEVNLDVYSESFYSNCVYFRLVNPLTLVVHQKVIYT